MKLIIFLCCPDRCTASNLLKDTDDKYSNAIQIKGFVFPMYICLGLFYNNPSYNGILLDNITATFFSIDEKKEASNWIIYYPWV